MPIGAVAVPAALLAAVSHGTWHESTETAVQPPFLFAAVYTPAVVLSCLTFLLTAAHSLGDLAVSGVVCLAVSVFVAAAASAAHVGIVAGLGYSVLPASPILVWVPSVTLGLFLTWVCAPRLDRHDPALHAVLRYFVGLCVSGLALAAVAWTHVWTAQQGSELAGLLGAVVAMFVLPAVKIIATAKSAQAVALVRGDAAPAFAAFPIHVASLVQCVLAAYASAMAPTASAARGHVTWFILGTLVEQIVYLTSVTGNSWRVRGAIRIAKTNLAWWWASVRQCCCRGCVPGTQDDTFEAQTADDPGEAHISPVSVDLLSRLYGQRVPKVFAQYDVEVQGREQLRAAEAFALVSWLPLVASVQVAAMGGLAAATGFLRFFGGIDEALSAPEGEAAAVRSTVLSRGGAALLACGVASAVLFEVGRSVVRAYYKCSSWRMLAFSTALEGPTLATSAITATLLVYGAATTLAGSSAEDCFAWAT